MTFLAMEAQLLLDYLSTNRFFFKLNQKKNTNQIRWMLIEVNLKLVLPPSFHFTLYKQLFVNGSSVTC